MIRAANAYIDHEAPWALKKTDVVRMGSVLRVLADVIRTVATVLQPFMPDSMGRMLDQLCGACGGAQFGSRPCPAFEPMALSCRMPQGIFPRFVEEAP